MDQSLETRVKTLEATVGALKKQLEERDRQVRELMDKAAIERLQCAYGYYLEHWMSEEIISLFADHPETSATFVEGTYLGLEGVRRYFGKMKTAPPAFLHQVIQVNPVITIDADGKTARGRWYGFGIISARPVRNNIDPTFMSVVYEMVYIKENGVWKILKLAFQMHYAWQPYKPESERTEPSEMSGMKLSPDIWAPFDSQYPSGYIYPMHFRHPVTGRETCEAAHNAALDLKPSRFQPE